MDDDSVMIVWDTAKLIPTKSFFNPHGRGRGISALDMTPDGKYIVSLSVGMCLQNWLVYDVDLDLDRPQTMHIWDWTANGTTPLVALKLDSGLDLQVPIHWW